MELFAAGPRVGGSRDVPLHLNSVTQFAAFSGPRMGCVRGDGSTECERGETRMHLSGHRAIRALAVFLVLALGVTALLPLTARAANQVTGLISTCVTTTPYVIGATVALIDANGINPTLTTVSGPGGLYVFTPPTGSYTISVSSPGYYPASSSTPQRFDGSRNVRIDLCLNRYGSPSKVLVVTVLNGGSPVSGASVTALNLSNPTGRPQVITTN